jgi:ethanolamine utilization protein EutQ (cupin superfamily)
MQDTTNKTAMITVKVTPSRLEEFRIAALLRGTTMSALISQFVAQVVREEQAAVPDAFKRRPSAINTPDLNDSANHSM